MFEQGDAGVFRRPVVFVLSDFETVSGYCRRIASWRREASVRSAVPRRGYRNWYIRAGSVAGEIGIVDGRNGHGDEIGALRTKISRRAVEDVTKIPGDAQHRVAAVLARRAIALESG